MQVVPLSAHSRGPSRPFLLLALVLLAARAAVAADPRPASATDLTAGLMAAPVGGFTLPVALPDWRELATAAREWRPAASPERGV